MDYISLGRTGMQVSRLCLGRDDVWSAYRRSQFGGDNRVCAGAAALARLPS